MPTLDMRYICIWLEISHKRATVLADTQQKLLAYYDTAPLFALPLQRHGREPADKQRSRQVHAPVGERFKATTHNTAARLLLTDRAYGWDRGYRTRIATGTSRAAELTRGAREGASQEPPELEDLFVEAIR